MGSGSWVSSREHVLRMVGCQVFSGRETMLISGTYGMGFISMKRKRIEQIDLPDIRDYTLSALQIRRHENSSALFSSTQLVPRDTIYHFIHPMLI